MPQLIALRPQKLNGLGLILDELERCICCRLYYPAIMTALSVPEICASLEDEDDKFGSDAFIGWYDQWLKSYYPELPGGDLWSLRNGLLHRGRYRHSRMMHKGGIQFNCGRADAVDNCVFADANGDVFAIHAPTFIKKMARAVEAWYAAKGSDPVVIANLKRMVTNDPNGGTFISGVEVLA